MHLLPEKKQLLGDYHVGKTIGQGAFSKVKLGFHKSSNVKVAIKIIDKKMLAEKAALAAKEKVEKEQRNRKKGVAVKEEVVVPEPQVNPNVPSFVADLQLEVQLLLRLGHPNIIRLYQVMETQDETFVIMEYATGGELLDHITAKGHLQEKEARKYFRQLISAMDHCHQGNVVHRDLKLENLLLNSEKELLISDFGLGRTFKDEGTELMKTFCGTPNYAAVELISGIPYIGKISDIWAMGVVLFIMASGNPPFSGQNITALYSKIKALDYKCPEYFSKELKCLFAKIFVKDPKKRITMDEMRSDAWVNFEEKELPSRILPKVVGSNDLADISQFISGITSDTNAVIYTLHRHTVVVPEVTTVRSSSIFHKRGKSNLVRLAIKAGKQNEDNCTEDNITPLSPANGNTGSRRRLNSANSPLSPKSPDFPSQPQNHQRAKSLSISRKSDSTSSNPRTVQVARRMSTIGPSVQEQKLEEKSKPERRNSLMSKTTTSNDPRPSVGPPKLFRSPSSVMDDINPFSVQDQDLNVTAEEIIDWHTFHKPPTEIRTVRFSFSASMTSTLPPALIFRNSHDAILELHDEFPSLKVNRVEEYYMMTGSLKSHEDVNVSFEIEVCKVWLLKVHGIRFKRLSGDPFLYKEVYKKFAECFERLNLNSIGV